MGTETDLGRAPGQAEGGVNTLRRPRNRVPIVVSTLLAVSLTGSWKSDKSRKLASRS